MDGAGKFVRGDAIAGVLITFINIIGGIIIGVIQNDMSFNDAAHSYTLLSVGDGLVTQIPALLVSTAAGLLVTKGGHDETSNTIIFRQMGASPSALGMTSGIIAILGILPGVPFFPFIILSGSIGAASWMIQQNKIKEEAKEQEPQNASDSSPVAPPIDLIRLELGYGLLCLLEPGRMIRINDQIKRLREQIAKDMGVILPAVRIQDNLTLDQNDYVIRIKEMESGKGTVRPEKLLLLDAKNRPLDLPGEETKEPTFGLQAKWIDPYLKEQAEDKGYTIVDPAIVISTHLSEIVKDNMVDLFTYTDVQYLLDNLSSSYKKLLSEMIPGQITISNIQRILQALIGERISIRDLPTILEGIFEASHISRNIIGMTEHVRQRLARQITFQFTDDQGILKALTLSPQWEEELTQALTGDGEIKQLILPPSRAQEFVQSVRQAYKKTSDTPVVISSPHLRVHVRSLLEHGRPSTVVLGKNEIHPKAHLRFVGQI
jgi:flagellar biosynthesis protein FlhA